jgi:hypothetical protein
MIASNGHLRKALVRPDWEAYLAQGARVAARGWRRNGNRLPTPFLAPTNLSDDL